MLMGGEGPGSVPVARRDSRGIRPLGCLSSAGAPSESHPREARRSAASFDPGELSGPITGRPCRLVSLVRHCRLLCCVGGEEHRGHEPEDADECQDGHREGVRPVWCGEAGNEDGACDRGAKGRAQVGDAARQPRDLALALFGEADCTTNQSMVPSVATSAALCRSPISP